YKGLKTKQKGYEVQTDMSADMLVRGTRWQAEVSVRGVAGKDKKDKKKKNQSKTDKERKRQEKE
ncbi:hypothetical protein Tco_1527815, partial [Tanacetum coccineum]